MLALMNMGQIAEKFSDIDGAKLTLPEGTEVSYLVDHDENVLPVMPNEADGSVAIDNPTGRRIIAGTSFNELSGGLLASMSYFTGLYRGMVLTEVVLKGQIGGVYVTYKFKAV